MLNQLYANGLCIGSQDWGSAGVGKTAIRSETHGTSAAPQAFWSGANVFLLKDCKMKRLKLFESIWKIRKMANACGSLKMTANTPKYQTALQDR